MGISFGNKAIKPYVGSKEVQEAYVGDQLVYRAKSPYIYYFLGGETDYVLNDIDLGNRAAITKPNYSNNYKIALTPTTVLSAFIIVTNVAQYIGKNIQFTIRANDKFTSEICFVQFRTTGTLLSEAHGTINSINEVLNSFTIPKYTEQIYIGVKPAKSNGFVSYLDSVRIVIDN